MLNNIKAEMARHGISKEELAIKLGISRRTLTNWICENTELPASALIQMSRMFKCSTDYLLGLKNNEAS